MTYTIYRVTDGADPSPITLSAAEVNDIYLKRQEELRRGDVTDNIGVFEDVYDWYSALSIADRTEFIERVLHNYSVTMDNENIPWFDVLRNAYYETMAVMEMEGKRND